MSTSGELLFLVCGFAATIAAVLTVTMRNPLRSTASVAMIPGPPALVTIAMRRPATKG